MLNLLESKKNKNILKHLIYTTMGKTGPKSKHGLVCGSLTDKGYVRVYDSGNQIMEHHFIWKKINGDIPKGYQIRHINGVKSDNRIENLELLSARDNKRMNSGCYKNIEGKWIKPCRKCGASKLLEVDFYQKKDGQASSWCIRCCKKNAKINRSKKK